MKTSNLKSRILMLIAAFAIITVSLSFTFSDGSVSNASTSQAESNTAQPIGGFAQDPK